MDEAWRGAIDRAEGEFTELTPDILESNHDLEDAAQEIEWHHTSSGGYHHQRCKLNYKRFRHDGKNMVCFRLRRHEEYSNYDVIVYSGTPSEIIELMHRDEEFFVFQVKNMYRSRLRIIDKAEGGFTEITTEVLKNNGDLKYIVEEMEEHDFAQKGYRFYYKIFIDNGVEMVCVRVTNNPTRIIKGNTNKDWVALSGTPSAIIKLFHFYSYYKIIPGMCKPLIVVINKAKGNFTEITPNILMDKNNDDLKVLEEEMRYHYFIEIKEQKGCKIYYKRFIHMGVEMVCIRLTRNPTMTVESNNDIAAYSGTPSEIIELMHWQTSSCFMEGHKNPQQTQRSALEHHN
ncbi:hypothetical protein DFH11DRAFT_1566348 [Phellopilus nigrolimitatus]|nr:hypothetical protein DFH11DRAFT_1566348 [Phellopilus nigrolimitatus]